MDAYHAPYTKEARYWTGLLLLSRLGLFLTFAINTFGNNGVNILAVATVSAALLAIKRRVYEDWVKDILESSFILNLCIFSVATFYLYEEFDEDTKSQHMPSFVSIGVALLLSLESYFIMSVLSLNHQTSGKCTCSLSSKNFFLLSTILRIIPAKDKTTTGDKDATELHT